MSAVVNPDLCINCEACLRDCSSKAIRIENDKAVVDAERCNKCGHCYAICPQEAVTLFDQSPSTREMDLSNVEDAVMMRKTVRHFSGPLSEEYLKELINKTRFCASACNFRPLHFLVINRAKLEQIALSCVEAVANVWPGLDKVQKQEDVIFRGAPHVIVVYTKEEKIYPAAEDAAIALSTLDLLAQKDQVGCFWAGMMRVACESDKIKELIGLQGKDVLSCMGIGKTDLKYVRPAARSPIDVQFI